MRKIGGCKSISPCVMTAPVGKLDRSSRMSASLTSSTYFVSIPNLPVQDDLKVDLLAVLAEQDDSPGWQQGALRTSRGCARQASPYDHLGKLLP